MIIFVFIFVFAFVYSFSEVLKGNRSEILFFCIFGLSIYVTTMSISYSVGLKFLASIFQPLKEILVLTTFATGLYYFKGKFKFLTVDYLVIAYFTYTFMYVLVPIGSFSFMERLSAFKSISFFALVYGSGRLININEINISKYYKYISLLAISAAVVLALEFFFYQHFQTMSGYADYNFYYFGQEASGNYGLSWTFETESGIKRFASFFSNPLEFSATTILAVSVVAGLYTNNKNQFRPDNFGKVALFATFFSILMSVSRASFASYFMVVYLFSIITNAKKLQTIFHFCFILVVIYFMFLMTNTDLYDFVINTLTFQNASSVGHIVEWLAGINAMVTQPLGLGLGNSGKIAGMQGENIGGENQFIIIGVQAGIIALLLYLIIHIYFIRTSWKWFKHLKSKERKICLTILLIKIGFLIPMMTSELETSMYISYVNWFLSGLFVTVISKKTTLKNNTKNIPVLTTAIKTEM